MIHNRPYNKASGIFCEGAWKWKDVIWMKCKCGLWHSNRIIPNSFWNQKWEKRNAIKRQKVGVILVRNKKEIWVTQSYNKCYGFPKGEKEENETIEECAKREFKEETGFNIDKINLNDQIVISTKIENILYIFYIIHVPRSFELDSFPLDDVEITSCGWVGINEILTLKLSKAIKRIFELFYKNLWLTNNFFLDYNKSE
jgi:8-oxo-dGTP pyrophosphatase MutT (NUDIX family)